MFLGKVSERIPLLFGDKLITRYDGERQSIRIKVTVAPTKLITVPPTGIKRVPPMSISDQISSTNSMR